MVYNDFMNASIASLRSWLSRKATSSRKHHCLSEGNETYTHPQYAVSLFFIRQNESARFLPLSWWSCGYFACVFSLAAAFLARSSVSRSSTPSKIPQLALRVKRILNNHLNAPGPVTVKHGRFIRTLGKHCNVFNPRKKTVCLRSWLYFLIRLFLSV